MKLVCNSCGSTNIHRDAWAVWNQTTQQWELGDTYDEEVWCDDCDEEGWGNIRDLDQHPESKDGH